ncbi:MAG: sulfatase [Akkermansiaceae bacterium]
MRLFFFLLFPALLLGQQERPNIVFLLVDDLGWGDFGCYGAEFYETPNIDRLAKEGMLFTDGYAACTVCSPTRGALLTGCYPARTHLTDWIAGHAHPYAKLSVPAWTTKIEHDRITLPEALKKGGYSTGFFGKWHLMPIGKPDFEMHYPTDHGFDLNAGGREWGQPKGRGRYFSPFDMPGLPDGEKGSYLTDQLTDEALDFIDKKKANPFFLYFSYYTLHGPLMAPEPLVEKYRQKAKGFHNSRRQNTHPVRAAMVEKLDDSVGRILKKLDDFGISDNTIVILTGDNGGNYADTSGGLQGYKGFSHEGGVRVPLIAKLPGMIPANTTSRVPVISMDFYPTLLSLAGLPARPDQHQDGVDVSAVLKDPKASLKRERLFWHYPHYHRTKPYAAIRRGDWKLIEFFETGKTELYDLSRDRGERVDQAAAHQQIVMGLKGDLHAWQKSVGAQMMSDNPNYDPKKAAERVKKKKRRKK